MATVTLTAEHHVPVAPWTAYCSMTDSDWLFKSRCHRLVPGAFISLSVPFTGIYGDFTIYARITRLVPGREVQAAAYLPWAGQIKVRFRGDQAGGTSVRASLEVSQEGLAWLARRRGLSTGPATRPDAVPLGLITSKSGPGAVFSQSTEHAARLAVEEINAAGGVRGRMLDLVAGDDTTNPVVAGLEVERLAALGCRTVVASVTSASYARCRQVAERLGVNVVYAILNEGGREGPGTVRLGERPGSQIAAAVPAIMRATEARSWFVVGHTYSWSRAASRTAHRVIPQAGGKIIGEARMPLGSTDYDLVAEQALASGADAVLSSLVGNDEVIFEEASLAHGLRGQVPTLSLTFDECVQAQLSPGGPADGLRGNPGEIWSAFDYYQSLDGNDQNSFSYRYRERYGPWAPPVSSMSHWVYRTIYLYADAVSRVQQTDSPELVSHIRGSVDRRPRRAARAAEQVHVARFGAGAVSIVS